MENMVYFKCASHLSMQTCMFLLPLCLVCLTEVFNFRSFIKTSPICLPTHMHADNIKLLLEFLEVKKGRLLIYKFQKCKLLIVLYCIKICVVRNDIRSYHKSWTSLFRNSNCQSAFWLIFYAKIWLKTYAPIVNLVTTIHYLIYLGNWGLKSHQFYCKCGQSISITLHRTNKMSVGPTYIFHHKQKRAEKMMEAL